MAPISGEEARIDANFRRYRGLLNKLTVEKFDIITAEILQIKIDSVLLLRGLIHLIFDKATDEPQFAFMYARLCERVQKECPVFEEKLTFRRLLLNKCQEEFEKKPDEDVSFSPSLPKKNKRKEKDED